MKRKELKSRTGSRLCGKDLCHICLFDGGREEGKGYLGARENLLQ